MRARFRTCIILLAAGLLFSLSGPMLAQAWPAKPIRVIMPYPPGAGADLVLRMVTDKLAASIGQPFVVDYKPGASTIIASELLARSAPDGYTIGFVTDSLIINPIFKKLGYDARTDFAPISTLTDVPLVVATHPSVPAKNLQEFVAYAKANPGKLSYGTAGVGSVHHIAMESIKAALGLDLVHVPYKGSGQSVPAFLAGEVPIVLASLPALVAHVKAGKAKLIAVTAASRSAQAPEVPAVAEYIPGYDFTTGIGLLAPAGTPAAVVNRISAAVGQALKNPELSARLVSLGLDPVGSTPEAFTALIRKDLARYSTAVKLSGAKIN